MPELMSSEREMIPAIIGLGKALGGQKVTNFDIARMMNKRPEGVERLMRRVGIQERPWATKDQSTSDLATLSLYNALVSAQIKAEALKAIIVGTNSADYRGVPLASMLQEKVGATTQVNCFDTEAGCVGFLKALYVIYIDLTSEIGQGGPQAAVGAEILTRNINPDDATTFPLFGDAAGAVIVQAIPAREGFPKPTFRFGNDGRLAEALYVPAGGSKFPASMETVRNKEHSIKMDGHVVGENAVKRMAEIVELVIQIAGVTKNDIHRMFPHQANLEIIKGVAQKLNFPWKQVYVNIERMGNTSTASIPVALKDAYDEGKLLPNELIVLCTFGAGLNWGAAVIPTVGLPPKS